MITRLIKSYDKILTVQIAQFCIKKEEDKQLHSQEKFCTVLNGPLQPHVNILILIG